MITPQGYLKITEIKNLYMKISLRKLSTCGFYQLIDTLLLSEVCKLIDQLRRQYKDYHRIYLSWDAASWQSSEQLLDHVEFLNGWAAHDGAPATLIMVSPRIA